MSSQSSSGADDTFPVRGTNMVVPLRVMLRHQAQVVANHGHSVHYMAENGGLTWHEMYAALTGKEVEAVLDMWPSLARRYVMSIVELEELDA